MTVLTETAYAKINLALHVRAREADGYHRIETLFAFAEAGDTLRYEPGEGGFALSVDGPFGAGLEGNDNLVLRAARGFADRFGGGGGRFHLTKRLPIASGIGGGSADAAAALRLLCRARGVEPEAVAALAARLGADVPACLASQAVRGDGRGDRLRPIDAGEIAGMPLLLVNPLVPVPTGPVYAGWDGFDRGALGEGAPLDIARGARNDLEPPARALQPVIGAVVAMLQAEAGVLLARMSGSGATCFALFADAQGRDRADAAIAQRQPGWWRLASRLR